MEARYGRPCWCWRNGWAALAETRPVRWDRPLFEAVGPPMKRTLSSGVLSRCIRLYTTSPSRLPSLGPSKAKRPSPYRILTRQSFDIEASTLLSRGWALELILRNAKTDLSADDRSAPNDESMAGKRLIRAFHINKETNPSASWAAVGHFNSEIMTSSGQQNVRKLSAMAWMLS